MPLTFGATAIGVALIVLAIIHRANAELENSVFTSRSDGIRLVVPRGWRASDAPSYPGVLLWLMRPEGKILLTSEPFTRQLYCSWPITCRSSHELDSPQAKFACALRQKLVNASFHIGPIQAGPKENEDAGLPSVWFDYDDGKHFMRQAVALDEEHAFSLTLSATSTDARNSAVRAFDQTLRTLRPLTSEEAAAPVAAGTAIVIDAGAIGDANAITDGGAAPVESVNAPAARIDPIGPCSGR
ncbi:MAG: hypothetical protein QM831_38780 [Kofleriaceae bacterium]